MPNDYERSTREELHKLQTKRNRDEKKIDTLFRESMIQYVIVFVIAFFMDSIAGFCHWQFQEGFGWQQLIVMTYCFVQIIRLYWKRRGL